MKLIFDPEYHGCAAQMPELPGCMSQDKTVKVALKKVRKAIVAHLTAMRFAARA